MRARLVLIAGIAITSLVALVAVNAAQDWTVQMSLRRDSATGELGGEASLPLFVGAQAERKATAVFLERPSKGNRRALEKARSATDEGITSFRHMSGTRLEQDLRHKWSYVETVYADLDRLAAVRERANGRGSREEVTGYYTGLLTNLVEFYQALSAMDDAELNTETRALVGLFWAVEGLAQEDMLLSAALAAGRMGPEDRAAFALAYGQQHVMYERWIAPYLPPKDKALYDAIVASEAWKTKERVEFAVINAPGGDDGVNELPPEAAEWMAAHGEVAGKIAALNGSRTAGLLAHGYQRADEIRSDVLVQVGGSSAAVLAVTALLVGVVRSIARRLRQVQAAAEGTGEQLPEVVRRLRAGQRVDPQAEFPDQQRRADEFTGLERALTASQRMVVEIAASQAADRRGFGGFVTVTTSRALNGVELVLSELDTLETRYGQDAQVLEDLIRLDQHAVRTRRHLDNLVTVTGEARHEPYTEPKTLADAVHDARAETAEPSRVENRIRGEQWLSAPAVTGVIHVLAALLDNALGHSRGPVTVTAQAAVHGVAVEIEDMGAGMTQAAFEQANRKLAEVPTFESMAAHDGGLGLFVVARLAARHGMRVRLRPSDYGGVKAVFLIPFTLMCPAPAVAAVSTAPAPTTPQQGLPQRNLPHEEPGTRRLRPAADRRSPAPALASPTAPAVGAAVPAATDPAAPALPRRRSGEHLAPQLARSPEPGHRPTRPAQGEVSPEEAGASWGAWQRGGRDGEAAHPDPKTADTTTTERETT
ncbi:sensor histidine kinase [Streptomyces sp. NPDC020965]|uniref:sensor histidine kinase n=1 Tax=Streptomyces sp. NPDC020965 TaxID=3365105 RepID=UPI0037BC17D4